MMGALSFVGWVSVVTHILFFFFFQAEDGIRDSSVTGVQTCALPISNGAIAGDTKAGAGKHAIRFATTPRLSTYLVAMLVGDFRCAEGGVDDIPIRVCAVPGKESLLRFALSAAEAEVHYYKDYFRIRYPFGKLSAVSVPDL